MRDTAGDTFDESESLPFGPILVMTRGLGNRVIGFRNDRSPSLEVE
jgi:hypothetical protein